MFHIGTFMLVLVTFSVLNFLSCRVSALYLPEIINVRRCLTYLFYLATVTGAIFCGVQKNQTVFVPDYLKLLLQLYAFSCVLGIHV